MIQFIKNIINEIHKNYERSFYYEKCFGRWIKNDNSSYYKIIFDDQQAMIDLGILEINSAERFEYSDKFEKWLQENLRGYYNIRGWGNGIYNINQVASGIWYLEVHCMREADALAIQMRWK